MKFQRISHDDAESHRLVLLFAGWGMSPRPLRCISMPGYEIAVVWDYRDMTAPWLEEVMQYDEVVMLAWSYGVHAAARFMYAHPKLPVTARIAVNGTRFTADDTRGIPRDIFRATLEGLSERSVMKFNMRMCGGAAAYKAFAPNVPERSIDDLREELQTFDTDPAPRLMWDKAFISDSDAIIPPGNQRRAWQDECAEIIGLNAPHLPDFNTILRRCLTDKSHVAKRFRKAEATYDDNAGVQLRAATNIINMVAQYITPPVGTMLEVGCGTGRPTRLALERFRPRKAILWDLHISPQIDGLSRQYHSIVTQGCDAEVEIRHLADDSVDLLLSASTVQWFNSLRTFLGQIQRVLTTGGVAAISTYGPDTMREIHAAMGTECRFPSLAAIRKMIPEGLELTAACEEHHTDIYDSPLDVLRHLSRTGVNGLKPSSDGDAAAGHELLRAYPVDAQGRARLTYHPIYLILRKP